MNSAHTALTIDFGHFVGCVLVWDGIKMVTSLPLLMTKQESYLFGTQTAVKHHRWTVDSGNYYDI